MGNSNDSKSFLQKGEGLRILSIKLNSPFDGKVQPFFDFIIDVVPLEPQRSPKQILEKLTSASQSQARPKPKDFNEIVFENEDRKLELKVVSTKHRNVRSLIITPNRNWNGSKDLIGISVRKQKYDEAFDTYFPITQIQSNSPIQLAGVKQGEYLIGCLELQYTTINNLIEGLYDRFFDKQVADKHVHLAVYDILQDQVCIKPILLKRGWGGNGLLGCQFLHGQIYKFPSNFKERRQMLLEQKKIRQEKAKIKVEIQECDGASKTLVEALKNKRNRKGKHMQNIRKMISDSLPHNEAEIKAFNPERDATTTGVQVENVSSLTESQISHQNMRIEFLENKISNLEQTLVNVRNYLDSISHSQTIEERELSTKLSC